MVAALGILAGLAPALVPLATKAFDLIDRLIPDPAAAEKAKREMIETLQKVDLAQLEINKVEAAHPSWMVAGARPAAMWVCVVALALFFWPLYLMGAIIWAVSCIKMGWVLQPYPQLGIADVMGILGPLLGIGAMRSYDKVQGTDTKAVAMPRVSPTQDLGKSLKGAR